MYERLGARSNMVYFSVSPVNLVFSILVDNVSELPCSLYNRTYDMTSCVGTGYFSEHTIGLDQDIVKLVCVVLTSRGAATFTLPIIYTSIFIITRLKTTGLQSMDGRVKKENQTSIK